MSISAHLCVPGPSAIFPGGNSLSTLPNAVNQYPIKQSLVVPLEQIQPWDQTLKGNLNANKESRRLGLKALFGCSICLTGLNYMRPPCTAAGAAPHACGLAGTRSTTWGWWYLSDLHCQYADPSAEHAYKQIDIQYMRAWEYRWSTSR